MKDIHVGSWAEPWMDRPYREEDLTTYICFHTFYTKTGI